MIELTDVTKRYGRRSAGTEALRDVSLTVPAGAVWAVVGPNGAGKSTLLSLLLGFIRPSAGSITVAGDAPRDYLRERGAGYLPERFRLPRQWLARDAMAMLGRMDGVDAADASRAIEMFGLQPHLEKQAGDLSRGLLQRLGLAQALLARHSLIVLDEPTEGLDPLWRVRLRDIIAELRSPDRTILIASHDLTELELLADRAIVLGDGAVLDVLDVRASGVSAAYRIRLALPFDRVRDVFPDASASGELEYHVTVGDSAELTHRLGGLIALGAIVEEVERLHPDLEERVRSALADNAGPGDSP